ncbi:hypothetical protein ACL03H_16735 [Saccharopolyspora sp. MS10]|uniref:hypothetical protein n=1 Tax=Saccharopolyspora sp. MS10 TaxID=3385973 RepID=UPI0039A23664
MPSPRRPGSSRPRVAGQRNRTGSRGPGARPGLNRPEEAEQQPPEDTAAPGTGQDGTEASPEDTAAPGTGQGGTEASLEESDATDTSRAADRPEPEPDGAPAVAGREPEEAATEPGGGGAGEPEPDATHDDAAPPDAAASGATAPAEASPAESAPADRAEDEGSATEAAGGGPDRRGSTGLIAAMLAAAVVLAGLATWFGVQAHAAHNGNRALADQAGTSEVNGQISQGVEQIFSYDFADTGKTERAAKDLLVGDAVGEYEQLFTTVKQQAPIQKLVVTTTVKASSVTRLEGDRAEVLLFVDQNATRTDIGGEPSVGPAQVVINAEKRGDRWKISRISQH